MDIPYPVRINKYLALRGFATRKNADELIKKKLVTINGVVATLGAKVAQTDNVEVAAVPTQKYQYLAYYKPRGEETGDSVFTTPKTKLFPVGRLDKDSEGLLILTDDGRITDRLLNPKYDHEKEYVVEVDKLITERFNKKMTAGVLIEGYTTRPAKMSVMGDATFRIILTEGKKHQIRRMCASLGYQVKKLKRTRVMNVKLHALSPGSKRKLEATELKTFLSSLDLH